MMFSATWPQDVRELAADFQKEAAFLNVGSLELAANHNITQHVEVMEEYDKQDRMMKLIEEINKQPERKTLIFAQTKRKADALTRSLRYKGFTALAIHGDKSQTERDWALKEFKTGTHQILVATDVAARGLDVDDIKFVINFDYSNNSEDYVHRIGRTGRRDKKGTSYTFFTPDEAAKASDLIKILEEAKQNVPPELEELAVGGYKPSKAVREERGRGYSGRGMNRSYGDRNRSYGGRRSGGIGFGGDEEESFGGYGGRGRW
ncbi:hypothetical protein PMAYCL1PPCAC_31563 [Pristionchus mayeri]|uniref:RNA helicase n=1 Tax=Pristionchus mayeri TaxID=1317129 RepID=A0AAN5DD77_9BILA|nr:hypothetical protein PMAYCL1PPCAC_31563 [Pristionchus mayeri]